MVRAGKCSSVSPVGVPGQKIPTYNLLTVKNCPTGYQQIIKYRGALYLSYPRHLYRMVRVGKCSSVSPVGVPGHKEPTYNLLTGKNCPTGNQQIIKYRGAPDLLIDGTFIGWSVPASLLGFTGWCPQVQHARFSFTHQRSTRLVIY